MSVSLEPITAMSSLMVLPSPWSRGTSASCSDPSARAPHAARRRSFERDNAPFRFDIAVECEELNNSFSLQQGTRKISIN
jgi:hypothetical protein